MYGLKLFTFKIFNIQKCLVILLHLDLNSSMAQVVIQVVNVIEIL